MCPDSSPLTIICGDGRLSPPVTPGDVFVKSAASTDLMFLHELGLPSYVFTTDRILASVERKLLEEELSKTNVLVIGSPIVNLMARDFNKHCLFRFIVDSRYEELEAKLKQYHGDFDDIPRIQAFWKIAEDPLRDYHRGADDPNLPPKMVEEIKAEVQKIFGHIIPSQFIANLIGLGHGLVDPVDPMVNLHWDSNYDFALISLGENPYNNNFACVMVAGFSELGTPHALRKLAEKDFFRDHPFGGVVKVQRQTPKSSTNKFEKALTYWLTKEYKPEDIIENLQEAMQKPLSGSSLGQLTPKQIEACLGFISTIEQANLLPKSSEQGE